MEKSTKTVVTLTMTSEEFELLHGIAANLGTDGLAPGDLGDAFDDVDITKGRALMQTIFNLGGNWTF